MIVRRRKSAILFAVFFLMGICAFGNHKLLTSYTWCLDAVKQDQRVAADSIDLYFETNRNITKDKMKEYMKLAMERDLDIAYIRPWFYFNIIVYNLFLLTAVLGFLGWRANQKIKKDRSIG